MQEGEIGHFWNIFRICERPLVIGTQYWTAMAPRIFNDDDNEEDGAWTGPDQNQEKGCSSSGNQNIVLFDQIMYVESPNHK